MDLDDEELKATRLMNGADKPKNTTTVADIENAMKECIDILSEYDICCTLVTYVNLPQEGDKGARGFISKSLNIENLEANEVFLLDYLSSLVTHSVANKLKGVDKDEEEKI